MKSSLGLLYATIAMVIFAGTTALGADVFVREAHGVGLSKDQSEEITQMVERAVQRMPDQRLVASEDLADVVLEPSITTDGDQLALRIDKLVNGEIVASSIEPLPGAHLSSRHTQTATENVLQAEDIVSGATSDSSRSWGRGTEEVYEREEDVIEDADETVSGTPESTATTGETMGGGDVRAPSPLFSRPDRRGTFQIGVGPAFSIGMDSDQLLYNVNLAYVMPVHDYVSVKGFGDLNMSAGTDPHRFLNFGAGADVFPMGMETLGGGKPYVAGDVGYAFTRNKNDVTQDAPAVGLGGGYKFATEQLNMDVNLHYTMLTAKLDDEYPSILGLRAALNF